MASHRLPGSGMVVRFTPIRIPGSIPGAPTFRRSAPSNILASFAGRFREAIERTFPLSALRSRSRVDKEWTRPAAAARLATLDEAFWAVVDASFDDAELAELVRRCKRFEEEFREDGA